MLPKRSRIAQSAETRQALKGQSPAAVWELVATLVYQAFEYEPDQAQALMDHYQPEGNWDQMAVDLMFQQLDPVAGLNYLLYPEANHT